MRVLVISNLFPPGFVGGYELGALDVTEGLHRAGHEIHVLTSDYFSDDGASFAGFPVIRTLESFKPSRRHVSVADEIRHGDLLSPANLRRLGSELIAFRPDSILMFNCDGIGVLGFLQHLVALGARPVLFLMDNVFYGLMPPAEHYETAKRIFGAPGFLDHVSFITVSQRLWAEVKSTLRQELPDPLLVPGWSDPRVDYAAIALPCVNGDAPVRFVFASRVTGTKGIDIVVGAARQLKATGTTNFIIDVYGAGDTAPLQQIVVAFGLSDHIHYRGVLPKSEMTRRLADYDALLLPTWEREPLPFVVPEAAAAGCIPVMTAGIGAAEWFSDEIDCFMIRRDIPGLAEAMTRLMRMPPGEREAMRQRCRETGLSSFSFDDALQTVEAELHRVAADTITLTPAAIRGVEAALVLLDGMLTLTEVT
jgi:glycosyltransferase involved in cell wall biosynthesis